MARFSNRQRTALLVLQHTSGIANAFGLFFNLDRGVYWPAAISALCVVVTAAWRIPPKPATPEDKP